MDAKKKEKKKKEKKKRKRMSKAGQSGTKGKKKAKIVAITEGEGASEGPKDSTPKLTVSGQLSHLDEKDKRRLHTRSIIEGCWTRAKALWGDDTMGSSKLEM